MPEAQTTTTGSRPPAASRRAARASGAAPPGSASRSYSSGIAHVEDVDSPGGEGARGATGSIVSPTRTCRPALRQVSGVPVAMPRDAEEADRGEQPVGAARVLRALAVDRERALGVEQPAGARADRAGGERQVDGAGQVAGVEGVGGAHVDDGAAGGDQPGELGRAEQRRLASRGSAAARLSSTTRSTCGGRGGSDATRLVDEVALVGDREEAVRPPLVAERRARLLAQARAAAERAADVAGPDLDRVVEVVEAAQGGVQRACALARVGGEVGTPDLADEQRIAGQERERRRGALRSPSTSERCSGRCPGVARAVSTAEPTAIESPGRSGLLAKPVAPPR